MTDQEKKSQSVEFAIESGVYVTQLTDSFKERKTWQTPDPKLVKAYIPGTIVSVHVKKGDAVKQGDLLVILEAMKMQNRIEMPFDGVIKQVYVSSGSVIPKHFIMIEIA